MGCIGQICPVLIFWRYWHIKLFLDMVRPEEGKREGIGQGFESLLPLGRKERIWRREHLSMIENELVPVYTTNTGEKRLFHWMRQEGFLIRRKGTDYNMPTQRSMEMMLFEVKERAINNPDGSTRVTKTTVVTGKGQQYFINKFLQEQGGE